MSSAQRADSASQPESWFRVNEPIELFFRDNWHNGIVSKVRPGKISFKLHKSIYKTKKVSFDENEVAEMLAQKLLKKSNIVYPPSLQVNAQVVFMTLPVNRRYWPRRQHEHQATIDKFRRIFKEANSLHARIGRYRDGKTIVFYFPSSKLGQSQAFETIKIRKAIFTERAPHIGYIKDIPEMCFQIVTTSKPPLGIHVETYSHLKSEAKLDEEENENKHKQLRSKAFSRRYNFDDYLRPCALTWLPRDQPDASLATHLPWDVIGVIGSYAAEYGLSLCPPGYVQHVFDQRLLSENPQFVPKCWMPNSKAMMACLITIGSESFEITGVSLADSMGQIWVDVLLAEVGRGIVATGRYDLRSEYFDKERRLYKDMTIIKFDRTCTLKSSATYRLGLSVSDGVPVWNYAESEYGEYGAKQVVSHGASLDTLVWQRCRRSQIVMPDDQIVYYTAQPAVNWAPHVHLLLA